MDASAPSVTELEAERSRARADSRCTQHYITYLDRLIYIRGPVDGRTAAQPRPEHVELTAWRWHPVYRLDQTGLYALDAEDLHYLSSCGERVTSHVATLLKQADRPDISDHHRGYLSARAVALASAHRQLQASGTTVSEFDVLHARHVRAQSAIAERRASRPWAARAPSAAPVVPMAGAGPPSPPAWWSRPAGQGSDDVEPSGTTPQPSPPAYIDDVGEDDASPSAQHSPAPGVGVVEVAYPNAPPRSGASNSAAPHGRPAQARLPRTQPAVDVRGGAGATHRAPEGAGDAAVAAAAGTGTQLPVNRGVDSDDAVINVTSTDLMSLRPGLSVSSSVLDWMVCNAASHKWQGEAYIVCNPRHLNPLMDAFEDKLEDIDTWQRRVDPLASGGDQRKAIIMPTLHGGRWSVCIVFHPGMILQGGMSLCQHRNPDVHRM